MQCPYCKQAMKKGFIQSGKTDLCWTLDQERPSWFINHIHEHQIMLAKFHYYKPCRVTAFYCPHCHKFILEEPNIK